ncbi:hypothetical protein PHLGIDRAFT_373011 [Phlebiopsis gigantea 11061_1 CR5-6]|uniref:Uncharacterized protein n=1 Tax=Phlebiopsis gigantea (strain 11061_1 CR5-6) TaxID=745531 RepID=A0A0C3NTK9_PHLG1|nr:hypothetical protein PHLGIDRAFT_373011 [Phlebiopsis gigantea 11061_1 CR5-6]
MPVRTRLPAVMPDTGLVQMAGGASPVCAARRCLPCAGWTRAHGRLDAAHALPAAPGAEPTLRAGRASSGGGARRAPASRSAADGANSVDPAPGTAPSAGSSRALTAGIAAGPPQCTRRPRRAGGGRSARLGRCQTDVEVADARVGPCCGEGACLAGDVCVYHVPGINHSVIRASVSAAVTWCGWAVWPGRGEMLGLHDPPKGLVTSAMDAVNLDTAVRGRP